LLLVRALDAVLAGLSPGSVPRRWLTAASVGMPVSWTMASSHKVHYEADEQPEDDADAAVAEEEVQDVGERQGASDPVRSLTSRAARTLRIRRAAVLTHPVHRGESRRGPLRRPGAGASWTPSSRHLPSLGVGLPACGQAGQQPGENRKASRRTSSGGNGGSGVGDRTGPRGAAGRTTARTAHGRP
jgi:hypothetical protein